MFLPSAASSLIGKIINQTFIIQRDTRSNGDGGGALGAALVPGYWVGCMEELKFSTEFRGSRSRSRERVKKSIIDGGREAREKR